MNFAFNHEESSDSILDIKTMFKYSSDPRKAITVATKIMDLDDSSNWFNYTLAVHLTHPITGVDLKVSFLFYITSLSCFECSTYYNDTPSL